MPLATTHRAGLVDQVIFRLKDAISADWPIGTRIPPEPELAESLGVGRNTVREAVRALVHAGLLEVRQGDGSYVRAKSEISGALRRLAGDKLAEVVQVRRLLEAQGARLAAVHRTASDLGRLDAAMAECGRAEEAANVDDFLQADLRFHQAVLESSHNAVLAELYRGLTEVVYPSVAARVTPEVECGRHTDLLEAIRVGDVEAAGTEARGVLDEYLGQ